MDGDFSLYKMLKNSIDWYIVKKRGFGILCFGSNFVIIGF